MAGSFDHRPTDATVPTPAELHHSSGKVEDMEDMLKGIDLSEVARPAPPPLVLNRVVSNRRRQRRRSSLKQPTVTRKSSTSIELEMSENTPPSTSSNVPGTQRVWVKTYGCSHNVSDSEYMQGMLDSYGYELVTDKSKADLWLINSCTVKDPSESAFVNMVEKGSNLGKGIVVAGCVPQGDEKVRGLENVSVVGISQIDRVVEVVEETLKGNTVRLLAKKELPRLDLPKIRRDSFVEIIPLSTGCLGSCTYCKTRHARGVLGSYTVDAIVNRARTAINEGVREIWLSSEDTGAYGRDIGESLPSLLDRLVELLPVGGSTMLRIGMTNPPFILDHLDEIAEALCHPQVFSFLHIPVQSASNRVLEKMNREYTVEEFCRVVDFLTRRVPDVIIATDIICGFPGETVSDWNETIELCKKYEFPVLNISQFYPRPGTPAARMKRVDTHVVKNRSRQLTKLFEKQRPFKKLLGRRMRVLIGNEVSEKYNQSVGHTKSYVKVLITRDDRLKGRMVIVDITETAKWHVLGKVVSVEGFDGPYVYEPKSILNDPTPLNVIGGSGAVVAKSVVDNVLGPISEVNEKETESNCCGGEDDNGCGCASAEREEIIEKKSGETETREEECCGGSGCSTTSSNSNSTVQKNQVEKRSFGTQTDEATFPAMQTKNQTLCKYGSGLLMMKGHCLFFVILIAYLLGRFA